MSKSWLLVERLCSQIMMYQGPLCVQRQSPSWISITSEGNIIIYYGLCLHLCWPHGLLCFSGETSNSFNSQLFFLGNSQVFLFANSKCKRYFHNRLKPSKLTWTAMYQKQHKKVNRSIFMAICCRFCVVGYACALTACYSHH